jgi:hypothetical protein
VLAVIGKYDQARGECERIARLTIPLVIAGCLAGPMSLSGSRAGLHDAHRCARTPNADPGLRERRHARWRDRAPARRDTGTALPRALTSILAIPSQAAYADCWRSSAAPSDVVTLLKDGTRNDSLPLRLRRIAMQSSSPITNGTKRSRRTVRCCSQRGDSLHRREEARYALELAQDRVAALKLARENWEVQREAADLRILVAAAVANGDSRSLQDARAWADGHHLEDTVVNAALERKP